MANTSVTYAGTGAQVNFTIPFPFISRDHVKVFVNGAEVLQPSIWYWVSDSQITFRNAPTSGAGIVIRRVTPGDTRLVDFQNGAVLTEADLDLSANQIFYLAQEAKENYAELVNAELTRIATAEGIVDTDPDLMIASLVDTMLADAAANTLQAAVGDIELNGEVILDIQTKLDGSIEVIDLIGAFNGTQTAFVLDTTKVKIDSDGGDTMATRYSTLTAADSANSASITTINSVTIPGIQTDVTDLEARYGVTLDVNKYVTGFAQNNDGETGTFVVLADKFAVVTPSIEWAPSTVYVAGDMVRPTTPTSPARVFKCTTGGTSGGSEPSWNTTLLGGTTDNTVTWTTYDDASMTPFSVIGDETFMTDVIARTVRYGQTGYDAGTGYFLGDVSGTAKFSIGDSSGDKVTWDGTTLTVKGDLQLTDIENYWTAGWTGFSVNPSTTLVHYVDLGRLVIIYMKASSATGTSNSNAFTMTGMPTGIRPSAAVSLPAQVMDNGVPLVGGVTIATSGVITGELVRSTGSNLQYANTAFTASGLKGFYGPQCWIYPTPF